MDSVRKLLKPFGFLWLLTFVYYKPKSLNIALYFIIKMVDKGSLIKNFKECIDGGLSEEMQKRYRNAVELYYKAAVALCDIIILEQEGDIPDYHKKRDEILEKLNGQVNQIRVGLHTIYRQSYYKTDFTISNTKEMKNAIEKIVFLKKPGREIEEIIKKI